MNLTKKIAVICPTFNRLERVKNLISSFYETITISEETNLSKYADLILAVEKKEVEKYKGLNVELFVVDEGIRGATRPFNQAALYYAKEYNYLMIVADDNMFLTKGWDKHFLDALKDNFYVYSNDKLMGEKLPTVCAMNSVIIHALEYAILPDLDHLYADNYWLEMGKKLGIKYLSDVYIEHVHPNTGKVSWDENYEYVNAPPRAKNTETIFNYWVKTNGPETNAKKIIEYINDMQ